MPQQVLGVSGEVGGTFLRSSVYITDCPSIRCLIVKRHTQRYLVNVNGYSELLMFGVFE